MNMIPVMTNEEKMRELEEKVSRLQFDIYAIQTKIDIIFDLMPWKRGELKTKEYCDTCTGKGCDHCVASRDPHCVPSNYELQNKACIPIGEWQSFNGYVVEMRGEKKPKEFRITRRTKAKDEPQTETKMKTQNSNLTFEKRTMRDCYNCKRYETEGECVECHYESKDEPQTDCAWK